MIKIIAKPTAEAAEELALKHGVIGLRQTGSGKYDEFYSAPDTNHNRTAVMNWFIDPDTGLDAPFSPGACLYYRWS